MNADKNTALLEILSYKRKRVEQLKESESVSDLHKKIISAPPIRDFLKAVYQPGRLRLIAELKKASPSAGMLRDPYRIPEDARSYEQGGAHALSILTEEKYFLGEVHHLREAKESVRLPILRKDFIIDPYQVYESRAYGADAILLIIGLLNDKTLAELFQLTHNLGMNALVEIHDTEELGRALRLGANIIGINSRNLRDLSVNRDVFRQLIPLIPKDKFIVAESGIRTKEDMDALKQAGANAALVGESLLRQPDLMAATKRLIAS
ncbi:MAG TPA: indole-3-glycerol phosphate synthase TrpC [Elusimicrobiota bacterium]|nr:indole-3-glycerol phosphate synthase TrpC [Elusimicrobiota bacterium]